MMWRTFALSVGFLAVTSIPLAAQDRATSNTLAADSAWLTIQSLLPPPLTRDAAKPSDSALAARYTAWSDTRAQLLRDVGSAFVQRFPHDTRVCQWLMAAESDGPTPIRYEMRIRPHAPPIGDFLVRIYDDSTTRRVAEWNAQLPALQTTCLQSNSPDSLRVQIASEQVESVMRPVQLDLWFPPDAAHPTKADTIHWDALSHAVLDLGAQFPNVGNEYVRNAPISLLSLFHKYHPVSEAGFLTALNASPNTSFRELAHAQEALAEARRTPLAMHVTGIDGQTIDLKNLKGKLVLLDFWAASWCGACRIQEPLIKAAYQKYHDKGLEIIGVALEDNDHRQFFGQYVKAQGIDWPQYFPGGATATDNEYFRRFGFDGAPQLLLLDQNGLLIGNAPGSNGIQQLEPLIKKQLGT